VAGIVSTARLIDFQRDPREDIWDDLAPFLHGINVGGADVLIAPFRPSEDAKTKGGVYLTDSSRQEYDFQGVAGLVLAMGPYAYKTEKTERWFVDSDGNPSPPQIGAWVVFNLRSSIAVVNDQHILTPIERPDMVM
jgi:hypothetical protein